MKKLFAVMEDIASNTVFQEEHEVTVYAKIGDIEGLQHNDGTEKHVDYVAKFAKDGAKARVRIITIGNETTNQFTLKIKSEDKLHGSIASSKEFTINVDDAFVSAFKEIADEPIVKTRYRFNTKAIPITYQLNGVSKVLMAESAVYEVDIFEGCEDICKIDLELDPIIDAIDDGELKNSQLSLAIKVSHLPFKPTEVLIDDGSEETKSKIDSFWDKVRSK